MVTSVLPTDFLSKYSTTVFKGKFSNFSASKSGLVLTLKLSTVINNFLDFDSAFSLIVNSVF